VTPITCLGPPADDQMRVAEFGARDIREWRIVHEERTLRAELPGYPEYTGRVRYPLIPYVW
jgi:hypothetical protein